MKYLLLCVFFVSISYSQPEVPLLKSRANDFTNTLTPQQLDNLNTRLKTFEDSTSNQLVMLMIATLDDYPIEYYSHETAQKNKIGTEEHDNGALLLIAKEDRKLRIEVGYGLEGALPDALASSIIRNVIVPHFKRNDYFAGINEGIDAIISAIAGEYTAENRDDSDDKGSSVISTILMIIFGLIMFFLRGRRRGIGSAILLGGLAGGFKGGRSGGFGGFSGGGFSGGGGSFGGGGASGSW
jgi:uncharacterized protein